MVQSSRLGALPRRPGERAPAAVIDHPGAAPRIALLDPPNVRIGETLLEVLAAPVNPLDLLVASGNFHAMRYEVPYVPGTECVGVVVESAAYDPGALVYAECVAGPDSPGTFATFVSVPDANVELLPSGIDPLLASAVGNSGVTAHLALVGAGALKAGETVLILGATGMVGQLAVQIAKLHDAGRVVGVGRDPEALARVLELGCDDVVSIGHEAGELVDHLRTACGEVDVVLDGVFGPPLEAALRVCGPHARVVNIGNLAGADATISAGVLRGRQLIITAYAGIHTPFREKATSLRWLWDQLIHQRLQMSTEPCALDQLAEVWRRQAASPHTKFVATPSACPTTASAREGDPA